MTDLVAIARSLFAPGKGLLAADESVHTATTRLAVEDEEETGSNVMRWWEYFFDHAAFAERRTL